jgi:hypothetical protein
MLLFFKLNFYYINKIKCGGRVEVTGYALFAQFSRHFTGGSIKKDKNVGKGPLQNT